MNGGGAQLWLASGRYVPCVQPNLRRPEGHWDVRDGKSASGSVQFSIAIDNSRIALLSAGSATIVFNRTISRLNSFPVNPASCRTPYVIDVALLPDVQRLARGCSDRATGKPDLGFPHHVNDLLGFLMLASPRLNPCAQ